MLFSFCNLHIDKHYPFSHILAMAPPLNHRFRLFIKAITILVVTCHLSPVTCRAEPSNYIRVAILQDAASLGLKVNGGYEIIDLANKKFLSRGKNLNTTVTVYKDSIWIDGKGFNTSKLSIKAGNSDAIKIDSRRFRGDIQLIKGSDFLLSAINNIELEDYIKGILYHEASHYWPDDALRAQAIVCRSYAIYQMQENVSKDYDVTSDIYSQVYGGSISERYRTNKAVSETKGLVLTYQGRYFPSYYHATCGGHTEDASLLWNIDMAPLRGVPCNFCKDSPHFQWHNVLSEEEVRGQLIKAGYQLHNIKNIMISQRDESGRVMNLKIRTDKKDINIPAKDFRNILGPNIVRSTNFSIKVVDHDIVLEGFGWGHGVGMCQWGAYFMAKQGYSYKQVLEYYYPGSQISLISK